MYVNKHDFMELLLSMGVKPIDVYAMSRSFTADPLQKFNFLVEIGTKKFGFQKVSGLSREIGVTTYYESGYDTEHKLKGRQVGGQIVCERGAYGSDAFATDKDDDNTTTKPRNIESLFEDSLDDSKSRYDVTITLQDRNEKEKRVWIAKECWVSKWEIDDLDSTSDDVIIEKITIEYESLEVEKKQS